MSSKYTDFVVIKDDREKNGWSFEQEEKQNGKFRIAGCKTQRMSTADYTIEGFQNELLIEKKSGFSEIAVNFFTKKNRERFEREMERLRGVTHKYILIEGNLDQDKLKLGLVKSRFAPPMSVVLSWLMRLTLEYNVHVLFVGDCGQTVARRIMEGFLVKKFIYDPKNTKSVEEIDT